MLFNKNGGWRKSLTTHLLLEERKAKEVMRCQIRTVRLMAHRFNVLAGQKGADLSRCVRTHIVIVNNDASYLVRFRICSKTLGKQIVVYHSELTMQRSSSGTVAT